MSVTVTASSPIASAIPGIFIHVGDLERSAVWYADLLGLPLRPRDRFDHIHVLELSNGVDLILDAKGFTPRRAADVLFMFDTADIDAAYRFVAGRGIEIAREIERAGPVSFFNVKDPDGNILMICQQHGQPDDRA